MNKDASSEASDCEDQSRNQKTTCFFIDENLSNSNDSNECGRD